MYSLQGHIRRRLNGFMYRFCIINYKKIVGASFCYVGNRNIMPTSQNDVP